MIANGRDLHDDAVVVLHYALKVLLRLLVLAIHQKTRRWLHVRVSKVSRCIEARVFTLSMRCSKPGTYLYRCVTNSFTIS